MSNRIEEALAKLFDKHRIVFWYDEKKELRSEFESVELDAVEKHEVNQNEFWLKYHMLREKPGAKFLLYKEDAQPQDLDNWLLDVQLAHTEFRTDQVGIWLAELELGLEYGELVKKHLPFFQAVKRREAIKGSLSNDDSGGKMRLKMLAICTGCDARVDSIVENLLQEIADEKEDKQRLITRSNLNDFLWERLGANYGYSSAEPSIKDFSIALFKSCYMSGVSQEKTLSDDALVLLQRWKDSRKYEKAFRQLSQEYESVLDIKQDLIKREIAELIEVDYFKAIDQRIIVEMVDALCAGTVSGGDIILWVRQRRTSHWFADFSDIFDAIENAARFIQAFEESTFEMHSLTDGIELYSKQWFLIDQFYRKFTHSVQASGEVSLLSRLSEKIESTYNTNFLLKINDQFQEYVEKTQSWTEVGDSLQKNFYEYKVKPFVLKDNRICVIISDAMRYEVGEELVRLIRKEDRYNAELEASVSMLPSYTQLGMAALLPHRELTLSENGDGTVLVDGVSSKGKANRSKILKQEAGEGATAVTAKEFMELDRDESRELLKSSNVVYIYHNRIDHTGDKIHSEGEAFTAAHQALEELIRLIKKLTAANANNMLVTADHGFIYQHRSLEESDFVAIDVKTEKNQYKDRRFIIGESLASNNSLHQFSSSELGLAEGMDVQIPKSINRLRLSGSGSRFVHGGASLQEIVIPVIHINKARTSDISYVDVEILTGSSRTITSGQLTVRFYQAGAVTEKLQARTLLAGIYTEDGTLISDSHELIFDFESENPRERELQLQFHLSKAADEYNGAEVELQLKEQHAGTSHYREYKSVKYMLRRSFSSDFDF